MGTVFVMCGKFKNVFLILYVYIWSILYKGTSQWSYPISLILTKQTGKDGEVDRGEITKELKQRNQH